LDAKLQNLQPSSSETEATREGEALTQKYLKFGSSRPGKNLQVIREALVGCCQISNIFG
jgi:hypothetical protein